MNVTVEIENTIEKEKKNMSKWYYSINFSIIYNKLQVKAILLYLNIKTVR